MHFTHYSKALVSLIMAILVIIDQAFGISFSWASEAWVSSVLAAITPILVWATPNKG